MEEGAIQLQFVFVPDNKPTEVAEPRESALHLPAPPVAAQLPPVLSGRLAATAQVWGDQVNAPLGQPLAQRVAGCRPIRDQPLDAVGLIRLVERRLEELALVRRGRRRVLSESNTLAVDHHHPLCALPAPRRPHCRAPFLAGAKLASAKLSLQSSSPCSSSWAKKMRQIFSQRPVSSHSCSRRQHVLALGYCSGRSRHGAPVRRIHSKPSSTGRCAHQRRPPLGCGGNGGSNGSIFAHCSSVSNGSLRAIGEHLRPSTITHLNPDV